ncbi:hypothetical protein PHMEG_00022246 [Phytophthora megakarya]|uniref:Uncharacterized protein n=1 Tax=Phytophthora megakarya TaxID=4795 RepID=A0A225VL97_9STRA|nr:hypothetical protein PHMEG_00022246 [Phytophthora megakarya]
MKIVATRQHAHPNSVFHCLILLPRIFKTTTSSHLQQARQTVSNWIRVNEATGTYQLAISTSDKRFTSEQRFWIRSYFEQKSLSYLDEAQEAFHQTYQLTISKTYVWRIIHDYRLTCKVLERRAIQVKKNDMIRFVDELSQINWSYQNIVLKMRYRSTTGVVIRGEFKGKSRVSLLAFINVHDVHGAIDYYETAGTFDREDVFAVLPRFRVLQESERPVIPLGRIRCGYLMGRPSIVIPKLGITSGAPELYQSFYSRIVHFQPHRIHFWIRETILTCLVYLSIAVGWCKAVSTPSNHCHQRHDKFQTCNEGLMTKEQLKAPWDFTCFKS